MIRSGRTAAEGTRSKTKRPAGIEYKFSCNTWNPGGRYGPRGVKREPEGDLPNGSVMCDELLE